MSSDYQQVDCKCCGTRPARHVNLYVNGSEGVWLCQACVITITDLVRGMMRVSASVRIQTYKECTRKA